jgi:hypothetical protein
MDAEQIKDKLVKYEKQYFKDIINNKLGCKPDSAAGAWVILTDSEEKEGCYNPQNNTFEFSEKYRLTKALLLHELLHFFQDQMDVVEREYFIIQDAETLRGKIKDFDLFLKEFVSEWWEYCAAAGYSKNWESHEMFFFLRSIILDLRCGFPLGTVFGYDLTESFASWGVIRSGK